MEIETLKELAQINRALRDKTKTHYNSRPLFRVAGQQPQAFDLTDLLLIGALTNSDVLLSGTTGSGKTHLAHKAMHGLFGDYYANVTVTPGLNESDFIDIDIGAVQRGEKTPKDAVLATPLLTRPGAIINEINRTPEILQNAFISYLERAFSLKGVEFPVGIPLNGNGTYDPHYQFRVLSINEGDEYRGTSNIDRAVRDRVVLEIPLDHFRPTREDMRIMLQARGTADLSVTGGKTQLDKILTCYKTLDDIPVDEAATEFLVYLSGMNNCVKSPTGSKRGIAFSPKLCEGCNHAKSRQTDKGNICGSVHAPSDRSLINLKKIGKGVALLRAYKTISAMPRDDPSAIKTAAEDYCKSLSVTLPDLQAIAPFVITNKMPLDPNWIRQHFNGDGFAAAQEALTVAGEKLRAYVASPMMTRIYERKGQIGPEEQRMLSSYAENKDPWAYSKQDLDRMDVEVSNLEELL